MFQIGRDTERNVLYVKIDGYLDNVMLREAIDDFTEKVEFMKPGFILINDLTTFQPPMEDSVEVAMELINLVKSYEPSMVIRIVDELTSGFHIFSDASEKTGIPWDVVTVKSMEEADFVIDRHLQETS